MKEYSIQIALDGKVVLDEVKRQIQCWRRERAVHKPIPQPVFGNLYVKVEETGTGTLVVLSGHTKITAREDLVEVQASLRAYLVERFS